MVARLRGDESWVLKVDWKYFAARLLSRHGIRTHLCRTDRPPSRLDSADVGLLLDEERLPKRVRVKKSPAPL